jgi:carboxypeptidase D
MTIQNMTFGGEQGFQSAPSDAFYVPYHEDYSLESLSASGIMGVTHTERKLTWVQQALSGHMVPQYQPSSGYRQLEFLLGRVDSLSSRDPFSTQKWVEQPQVNATDMKVTGVKPRSNSMRMPRMY